MIHLTPEQEKLKEALQSFPDKNTPATLALKQWPEYNNLYQALCGLGDVILNLYGRFMYNPISILRKGDYYQLGINPGFDSKKPTDKKLLCEEIRDWSNKPTHAICVERGKGPYWPQVMALCHSVGIKVEELCCSNLYFCSSEDEKSIPINKNATADAFWRVHEAVLDIVKPKCILVFGTGEGKFPKILDLMTSGNNDRRLLHTKERRVHDGNYQCRVLDGEYQGRPLKLIGIPYPGRSGLLTSRKEVLDQIVKECQTAG